MFLKRWHYEGKDPGLRVFTLAAAVLVCGVAGEEVTCLPHWLQLETSDPGLTLFNLARPKLPAIPHGGRVLEVGYRDTPWSLWCKLADPSLHVTAIDWRPVMEMEGVEVLRGNVLAQGWPAGWFDAVVGLSSFEHVGLGHYEHDPVDRDGDIHLLQKIRGWLKPGGWCYFDVPYRPEGYLVSTTEYRAYDDRALQERFGPVEILGYTRTDVDGWIEKPAQAPSAGRKYHYVACVVRA